MSWAKVLQLGPRVGSALPWRAILVEDPSRQEIRIALWAPDHRVRWVASLLWDRGIHPLEGRSECIARARALARDAMKCASVGMDLDAMPCVDLGLKWGNARALR